MKTPHSGLSTRVWVKALAGICVANAVLLAGVDAACVDLVSGGDKGVGISAFDDAGCANGGLGCFQPTCRYCKTRESPQASQFLVCPGSSATAAVATTAAPVQTSAAPKPVTVVPAAIVSPPATAPVGVCADTVPGGDKAVGISAVTDLSCRNGGLGCFADGTCRYCKTKDTPQAGHFMACANFAPVTSAPVATTLPVTSAPVTAAPVTSAPVIVSPVTQPPATAAPPATAPVGVCADTVPGGDKAVGISAVTDLSCRNGGLGCFADGTCRYCKTKDTPQAGHFMACANFAPATSTPVATATPVTVAPVTSAPVTAAPVTSTPVTTAPVTQPPATAAPPATAPVGVCVDTVPGGDKAVGISAVTDLSCKNGGLGCFADGTCRYCKTKDTPQAGHFMACANFAPVVTVPLTPCPPTPAPATATPAALAPSTLAPVSSAPMTPAPVAPAPQILASTTIAPSPTLENPIGGQASVGGIACSEKASPGDQLNGIKVITDISCVYNPVVGCFKDICRFCKTRDTIASSNFLQCPETAAPATSTPQPTAAPMTSAPAPVSAPPAPIPAPPVPSVPGTAFPVIPASTSPPYTGKLCTVVVSTGDSQVGIKAIIDPGCQSEAKVGCFESVCRYCKTKSTPQSNHLLDCPIDAIPSGLVAPTPAPATVPTFTPPASGTPAPTSAPVSSPSPAAPPPTATVALSGQIIPQACKRTVSPGDALQGIAVITDSSCLGEPGVGCVDSFCRFCKTKDTAASGHLLPCCDFPTVPTSVKTPGPNLCSSAVQPSQALSGIWTNVVCSQWYRGQCLKSACPLCKFFDTSASSSLAACVAPTTAPAVPAPMPGAPAANLCSDAMLSEEQPSFGIWAMWDQTCASSQSDCVSKCRYCKYGESAQSAALKGCSSITPLPPPPVFVPPPPGSVRPPTPSANECSGSMTTQDAYNGVWRNAQCFETNAAGACVSVVCSPCSFFDTAASFKFPDCVNGITPYWSSSPAVNLQLALSSGSSSANAAAGALSPLEIAVAVAAVVGIATLFVVAVIGTKRAVKRTLTASRASGIPAGSPATPSILAIVSSDEPDEPPQPRSVRPRKVKAPRTPLTA